MLKLPFNDNWSYRRLDANEAFVPVTLPHDAMIYEPRSKNASCGVNGAWFEGRDYEYQKTFFVPAEYEEKDLILEFEGVYRNAEVFLNGRAAAYRPYGYTNFYVPLAGLLNFGCENTLCVIARNADQPNARWYSGAGIYRPVWLYVGEKKRVEQNGLRVVTRSIDPAVIEVKAQVTRGAGDVTFGIFKDGKEVCSATVPLGEDRCARAGFTIQKAALWSPDHPALYECRARYGEDESAVSFGIRTVSVSAKEGFLLNGSRVILRGACIHHDNGILGARCIKEAEERKVALLKKWGYNAIRSAHNPCSKYLLDACDRLGMLVMDEYCDTWYIHKNLHDYADHTEEWYARDIKDMVDKDFNHPSVFMYSLGNEVAETADQRGTAFFCKMRDVIRAQGDERPVTVAVNPFFNLLYAMGLGVYSDEKARKDPQRKVGSAFFNALAGIFGGKIMKNMARLRGCDVKTRGCYAEMDVAGYNYGILRYKKDIKKYPDRVILGTETFCADAYRSHEFAKVNPAVIGDFVWAGIDYLGECGLGAWEYRDDAPTFRHGVGWLTAGCGRLDLTGEPSGEALYTRVAFGLEDAPQIAVVPVNHTRDRHSPSAWRYSNARPSWSWDGQEGKKAKVEVYTRAPYVELYVNGRLIARKRRGKDCRVKFLVPYEKGEITAAGCARDRTKLCENSLCSADGQTFLAVEPEKSEVSPGEVCFVRIRYTDRSGVVKPLERGRVTVRVEGGELLALGSAAPYNVVGYTSDHTDTYFGQALAVIRLTSECAVVRAFDGERTGEGRLIARG